MFLLHVITSYVILYIVAGKTHPLSEEERTFCRQKLLVIAINESDNTMKALLAESIRIICETDYPEK